MADIRHIELRDYRDLFLKLEREFSRFDEDPTADTLFNAMVTAWCLADWVLEDIDIKPTMHSGLMRIAGRVQPKGKRDRDAMDVDMRICEDIAVSSKHAIVRQHAPTVVDVSPQSGGFGLGPFGFGPYGSGTYYLIEIVGDGEHELFDAYVVIERVIALYREFFTEHQLI